MTKTQLKAYRDLKLERDNLVEMINELETILYGPKAQRLDGMARNPSLVSLTVENSAIKLDELLEVYTAKVAELSAALVEIENAIEALPPRERILIRLHYAKGLTWEEVCIAMSYSWRQVHRIHATALERLRASDE